MQTGPRHEAARRALGDVRDWQLPPDHHIVSAGDAWLLKYAGPKEPASVAWRDEYKPLHIDDGVAKTAVMDNRSETYAGGRLCALTKEFPHQLDGNWHEAALEA
eukprot:14113248-Alexandrium_andersonii.AAC.1